MMIWFLMVIPVIATFLMLFVFERKKTAWWEYLLLYGASILTIVCAKWFIELAMTSDTEYWSETAVEVEYEGAYDEYIHKTCTREYACGTDSKGNTEYCTETYDCSYVEHYSPKYRIKSNNNSIYITSSEYNRIKSKWGNEKKTGTHPEAYTYDDGIYSSYWLNRRELIECMVESHRYENRVQAAHTIFKFRDVSAEDKKKYALYDYPKIYDYYKQECILGPGDKTQEIAEHKMQILNAELGPKKQVKAFILIFRGQPKEAGIMQEAYWEGGNKNEFVLTIGVDKQNRVQWTYPFTWAQHSIVKVDTREFVLEQSQLNLEKISDFLYEELDKKFVRKHFSEFNYLTVEPSTTSIVWSAIVLIIFTILLVYWFVTNEYDDDLMGGQNQQNKNQYSKHNWRPNGYMKKNF